MPLALVVVVASAAVGYRAVFGGGDHSAGAVSKNTGTDSGTTGPDRTVPTAQAFLNRWAAGDLAGAGALTDNPKAAAAALGELRSSLKITSTALTARPPDDTGAVPFHVTLKTGSGTWSYDSALSVADDGRTALVQWSPSLIHPHLTDETVLRLGQVTPSGDNQFVDRTGRPIDPQQYQSLAPIVRALQVRQETDSANPGRGSGTPGVAVQVVSRDSNAVLENLVTLRAPVGARTTLDLHTQDLAERTVAQAGANGAALVVLQPSSGHILAIANNPATGYDIALRARVAPGSTMKVLSSTALLRSGLTPSSAAPCPPSVAVNGKEFHNAGGESLTGASLIQSFAISCNTAFIGLRDRLTNNALGTVASDVFGVTRQWDIGLGESAAYGSVPVPADEVTRAADMIGQGDVGMSPLAMASVAATVESGQFRQPVLLPGAHQTTVPGRLSPATASALRSMMRRVVTSGTATTFLSGLPGDIGAKTGTADVAGQVAANSWLIAYRGDLAVACLVEGTASQGAAGPLVGHFLRALS